MGKHKPAQIAYGLIQTRDNNFTVLLTHVYTVQLGLDLLSKNRP